jgi:hypothetical protein
MWQTWAATLKVDGSPAEINRSIANPATVGIK